MEHEKRYLKPSWRPSNDQTLLNWFYHRNGGFEPLPEAYNRVPRPGAEDAGDAAVVYWALHPKPWASDGAPLAALWWRLEREASEATARRAHR